MMRNNEVRSVMLYGIPIVALVMDNQERLCLAQISNTLLKHFSYNEIHNRRVALGITCVQCTPVQLELLRRAGAMPVSSRRCGMITKREAERLCKSFLQETSPPKLPDSFSFDVVHNCAWGCRGAFNPSRYNSSRAKCIKCCYCGLFFSPNKFIFHSHRLPESKYVQPDAANFNSWRRHIKLYGTPPDDISFAWEDVKAMFNGGSRKRAMAASLNSVSKQQQQQQQMNNQAKAQESMRNNGASGSNGTNGLKRQRMSSSSSPDSVVDQGSRSFERGSSPPPNKSLFTSQTQQSPLNQGSGPPASPYPFPFMPMANKSPYQVMPSPSGNAFPQNTSTLRSQSSLKLPPNTNSSPMSLVQQQQQDFRQSFAEFMWSGKQPSSLPLPYSCLLWPRPPPTATTLIPGIMNGVPSESLRGKMNPFNLNESTLENFLLAHHLSSSASMPEKASNLFSWERPELMPERSSTDLHHPSTGSAFKPVIRNGSKDKNNESAPRGYRSPSGSSGRSDDDEGDGPEGLKRPRASDRMRIERNEHGDDDRVEDEDENEVDVIGDEKEDVRVHNDTNLDSFCWGKSSRHHGHQGRRHVTSPPAPNSPSLLSSSPTPAHPIIHPSLSSYGHNNFRINASQSSSSSVSSTPSPSHQARHEPLAAMSGQPPPIMLTSSSIATSGSFNPYD